MASRPDLTRARLAHLLDRVRRGAALPAELNLLEQTVTGVLADRDALRRNLAAAQGRKAGLRTTRPARIRETRSDRIDNLVALRLAANGLSNAQIGRRLHVSEETVRADLKETYRRLGAIDRTHAVGIAMRLGLICLGEIKVPEQLRLDRAA
jgi:DNA-binding CsgD family transcriptional regulator